MQEKLVTTNVMSQYECRVRLLTGKHDQICWQLSPFFFMPAAVRTRQSTMHYRDWRCNNPNYEPIFKNAWKGCSLKKLGSSEKFTDSTPRLRLRQNHMNLGRGDARRVVHRIPKNARERETYMREIWENEFKFDRHIITFFSRLNIKLVITSSKCQ